MTESRNYGMTDRLKTVYPPKTSFCGGYKNINMSEPAQEKWLSQTIHTYKPYWLSWVVIFMKHILSVMTS